MSDSLGGDDETTLILVADGGRLLKDGGTTLIDLVMRYVAERRNRGELSKTTALHVRGMLVNYLATTGATRQRYTTRQVEEWLYCRNAAPSTTRVRLSTLRGFYAWANQNRYLAKDPTVGVGRPKLPQAAPRKLTIPAAAQVMRATPDARGRLIVLLMLQEGLRCVEVSRLEVGDVDTWSNTLAVRGKGGAGNFTSHIPISDETARELDRYLAEHPCSAGPLVRSYNDDRSPITASHISRLVSGWMREAGVKAMARDGKSAHALRHTMASHLVERGEDVLVVQQALGHTHLSSTQIYLRGVTPDLRRAMGGRIYADLPNAS